MALDRVGATLQGEMMETIAKLNSHFAAAHKQLSTAEKTPARGSELRISPTLLTKLAADSLINEKDARRRA